ncbi:uncharacterized protein LOC119092514 [Pollicipes pollicipes]|uniref:uncharacterized protein LOC119092514 n=1 Tax=Pollicipes pollicipes TaxID=41117 RepID=UPI0018857577|nr:uncharacterized protein LOC119092514 [Pollicipes pollicipes]
MASSLAVWLISCSCLLNCCTGQKLEGIVAPSPAPAPAVPAPVHRAASIMLEPPAAWLARGPIWNPGSETSPAAVWVPHTALLTGPTPGPARAPAVTPAETASLTRVRRVQTSTVYTVSWRPAAAVHARHWSGPPARTAGPALARPVANVPHRVAPPARDGHLISSDAALPAPRRQRGRASAAERDEPPIAPVTAVPVLESSLSGPAAKSDEPPLAPVTAVPVIESSLSVSPRRAVGAATPGTPEDESSPMAATWGAPSAPVLFQRTGRSLIPDALTPPSALSPLENEESSFGQRLAETVAGTSKVDTLVNRSTEVSQSRASARVAVNVTDRATDDLSVRAGGVGMVTGEDGHSTVTDAAEGVIGALQGSDDLVIVPRDYEDPSFVTQESNNSSVVHISIIDHGSDVRKSGNFAESMEKPSGPVNALHHTGKVKADRGPDDLPYSIRSLEGVSLVANMSDDFIIHGDLASHAFGAEDLGDSASKAVSRGKSRPQTNQTRTSDAQLRAEATTMAFGTRWIEEDYTVPTASAPLTTATESAQSDKPATGDLIVLTDSGAPTGASLSSETSPNSVQYRLSGGDEHTRDKWAEGGSGFVYGSGYGNWLGSVMGHPEYLSFKPSGEDELEAVTVSVSRVSSSESDVEDALFYHVGSTYSGTTESPVSSPDHQHPLDGYVDQHAAVSTLPSDSPEPSLVAAVASPLPAEPAPSPRFKAQAFVPANPADPSNHTPLVAGDRLTAPSSRQDRLTAPPSRQGPADGAVLSPGPVAESAPPPSSDRNGSAPLEGGTFEPDESLGPPPPSYRQHLGVGATNAPSVSLELEVSASSRTESVGSGDTSATEMLDDSAALGVPGECRAASLCDVSAPVTVIRA